MRTSIFLLCFFCGIAYAEREYGALLLEDAEVKLYKENIENVAIAEELQYYDFDYILNRLPTLKKLVDGGVRLMSGDIAKTTNKPVYRLAMVLKGNESKKDLNAFKEEFQKNITELANEHDQDQKLCWDIGIQLGKKVKTITEMTADESWGLVHPIMREGQSLAVYKNYMEVFWEGGYKIKKQEYIFCQSYRKHPRHNRDILVLRYGVDFVERNKDGNIKGEMQVTAMRDGPGWGVAGFRVW